MAPRYSLSSYLKIAETPVRLGSIVADGKVDIDLLQARCKEQLADYTRPRFLVQLESPLPRTYSGKVLKRELRQQFSSVPVHALSLKEAR